MYPSCINFWGANSHPIASKPCVFFPGVLQVIVALSSTFRPGGNMCVCRAAVKICVCFSVEFQSASWRPGKPGVMITPWESLLSWKGQSGSPGKQEPQTRTAALARTWATASSNASLWNVMSNLFYGNKLLGLIDSCCFPRESICDVFRLCSLLFLYTIPFLVFLFYTSLFSQALHFFLSLAEGFLPDRFSWLNRMLRRNALPVSFS